MNILSESNYNFASDVVNIIVLVYDYSGSMEDDVSAIVSANKEFKRDFSHFEEKGSIAISKCRFSNTIGMTPFLGVEQFETSYNAHGGTRLYEAIHYSAQNTIEYYNEIVKRLNVRPRITFLVFSDGLDTSYVSSSYAKNAVAKLNSLDATTVFVAFREANHSGIGEKLGFSCTRNIDSVQELISCLGTELSQSCKLQSKSVYSLKSAFFSKAAQESPVEEEPPQDNILDDTFFDV